MKLRLLYAVVTVLLILCGCSGETYSDSYGESYGVTNSFDYSESSDYSDYSYEDISDDYSDIKDEYSVSDQMLVYSCTLQIDTLDFDKSVDDLSSILNDFGGYKESEYFTDGASTYGYDYIADTDKHRQVSIDVRIPSSNYEEFLIAIEAIGSVRSKNSSVDNVTETYNNSETALEIYKSKRQRYLERLSTLTDDAQAIAIESELTDLDIKIAQLESVTSSIEKDVAYSSVSITLKEVVVIEVEGEKTESVSEAIRRVFNKSLSDLKELFVTALLVVIYLAPLLIIIAIIIGILLLVLFEVRHKRKHKAETKSKEETS